MQNRRVVEGTVRRHRPNRVTLHVRAEEDHICFAPREAWSSKPVRADRVGSRVDSPCCTLRWAICVTRHPATISHVTNMMCVCFAEAAGNKKRTPAGANDLRLLPPFPTAFPSPCVPRHASVWGSSQRLLPNIRWHHAQQSIGATAIPAASSPLRTPCCRAGPPTGLGPQLGSAPNKLGL